MSGICVASLFFSFYFLFVVLLIFTMIPLLLVFLCWALGSLVCFSSFLSLANTKTPNTTMNDDGQNDESKHGGGGDQMGYDGRNVIQWRKAHKKTSELPDTQSNA